MSKIFNADENIVPFAIVSVGYPAEEKKFEQRYDETKVFYNTYRSK